MACSSARSIVFEEMEALLQFIETENSQYEKERNELKAQFHSRPQEERNIVKDILSMHSEFDSEVSKVKNIVEELSKIPIEKTSQTTKAEDLASQIVIMQASLVRKHDILQKFLVQKINYQRLSEEASLQAAQIEAANDNLRYRMMEIANYEKSEIFAKKVKLLNSEIHRLSSLVEHCDNPAVYENGPNDVWEESVSGLTEKEAEHKLKKIQSETSKLEKSIAEVPKKYVNKETYLRLVAQVEEKRKVVENLKPKLNLINNEGNLLTGSYRREANSNMLGAKHAPAERVSPREGRLKSNGLLKKIEASLNRVRAIASPMPRNS